MDDYAIKLGEVYNVSCVVDPGGLLYVKLTSGGTRRPFFWPASKASAVLQLQDYVRGI